MPTAVCLQTSVGIDGHPPLRVRPSNGCTLHYDLPPRCLSKAELHHVAIGHDVVLALEPDLSLRPGGAHRTGRDQVLEGDHLGLDEALLEVGMDHPGGLGGG